MTDRAPYNVLFLCTGNSARSILAEAILQKLGEGRFNSFSAGSFPKPHPHPAALKLLEEKGHDISMFRSKSWDEFAADDAPELDFIFTVCDNAANEVCPIWPGRPSTAHWGLPDPAAVEGTEAEIALAFADTYRMMTRRIEAFVALPIASLERQALKTKLDQIGTL